MGFESWAIRYLANSLWMVPLVFCAAWVAARAMRRVSVAAEHRMWVAALAMEVLLPGLRVNLAGLLAAAHSLWGGGVGGAKGVTFAIFAEDEHARGGLAISSGARASLIAAYGGIVIYFAARLAWGLWRTRGVEREAEPVVEPRILERWVGHTCEAGVSARLLCSAEVSGPATVGMRRPALLVPRGFLRDLEAEEMDALMAHECSHIRRCDFAKNVLYNVLVLPASYHPAMWATWSRMTVSREMVCDAMAADAVEGRERYARSLLRLAASMLDRQPVKTIHAIGIFDANSLEGRVMQLTRRTETGRMVRVALTAVCVTLGVATCASAMAMRVEVGANPASSAYAEKDQATVTMPVLIESAQPDYPKTGKAERIDGSCVISLTVDEEGMPTMIHVKKSLRPEFDEEAVKAIRKYRFKPATRDGQPVAKDLSIEVRFQHF